MSFSLGSVLALVKNTMVIETELKFAIKSNALDNLLEYLHLSLSQPLPAQSLMNSYYETDDQFLRRHDMALRIRGEGERYEQTLKTAGQSIGGLHQRPEYNVPLKQPVLELDKFPADVWPEAGHISELSHRLKPWFTTNFTRVIWLISEAESEIELALDRGSIEANGQVQIILELEMELKKGSVLSLFDFANTFISNNQGAVRLSNCSKAERGYQLAQNVSPKANRSLRGPELPQKLTCEAAMQQLLSYLLTEWQYLDRVWLEEEADLRPQIASLLSTIRQVILLFGGLIPRRASHELRRVLAQLDTHLLSEKNNAQQCCFHPQWVKAQLTLAQWLVLHRWRDDLNEKQRNSLANSYKRWSDTQLSRLAASINKLALQLGEVNHQSQLQHSLQQQLTLMRLLSSYYPIEKVDKWLTAWMPLLADNIANPQVLYLQARKLPDYWLSSKNKPKTVNEC